MFTKRLDINFTFLYIQFGIKIIYNNKGFSQVINIKTRQDLYNSSGIDRRYFFKVNGYNNKRLSKYFRCSPTLITLTLDSEKLTKKLKQIIMSKLVEKFLANENSKAA